MTNKHRKQQRNELRALRMRVGFRIRRARGIIHVKGNIPKDVLIRFRAEWERMLATPGWARPIFVGGDP